MSAPKVDVLAVLDGVPSIVELAANDLLTMYSTPGGRPHDPNPAIADELQKVREARAAVADLIDAANSALYDMREVRDRCTSLVAVGLDEQLSESIEKIAEALDRIGGAA